MRPNNSFKPKPLRFGLIQALGAGGDLVRGKELLEAAIYADVGYVADLYESLTGTHPHTTITRNEGKKAGVSIPIFSAELSAVETRSYAISTLEMLAEILPDMEGAPSIQKSSLSRGMSSQIGWVEGKLSVFHASSSYKKRETGEMVTTAKDQFFGLTDAGALDLALITNPSYFALGLDTFLRMQHTLLDSMSIPVRAYVRIFSAQSHMSHWVAVPLLILERRG
jgi:hypothetical protein